MSGCDASWSSGSMRYRLRMTAEQHHKLANHLLPEDGKEAAALLLCGRRGGMHDHVFMVEQVVPIPYAKCKRSRDRVTWPTDFVDRLLPEASDRHLAIVKAHSHRQGNEA